MLCVLRVSQLGILGWLCEGMLVLMRVQGVAR